MKARTSAGSTFRVHDVDTVRTPIPTCKTRDSITKILGRANYEPKQEPIFWCTDYNSEVIETVDYHGLLGAIHTAFSEHRPLVLSPDAIWICILQGVAHHVRLHSEELQPVLVAHTGRKQLVAKLPILDPDSPESDWHLVVSSLADLLNADTAASAELICDFSTTGALEILVSQAAVLDVYESFYEYIVLAGCGFPEITLTGSSDDWLKLLRKIDLLEPFRMDFWLPHLREIANNFYEASCGRVDLEVWKDMYKLTANYGNDICNGWIAKLVPYIRNEMTGNWDQMNQMLVDGAADPRGAEYIGIRSNELPSGMSVVPFLLYDKLGVERPMEIVAGFTGVEQDQDGRILPKLGCAVRKQKPGDWSFLDESKIEMKAALSTEAMNQAMGQVQEKARYCMNISKTTFALYKHCDGFTVPGSGDIPTWRLSPLSEVSIGSNTDLEAPQELQEEQNYQSRITVLERCLRFAESSDGGYACVAYSPPGAERVTVYDRNGKCVRLITGLKDFVKRLLAGKSVF